MARRFAVETAEPKLLAALQSKTELKHKSKREKDDIDFVEKTLRQWGLGKPNPVEKATSGVLGALAYRFKLWGIAGAHEDSVRRSIERSILAANKRRIEAPLTRTRAKGRKKP